jgi:hypothetical protein
MSTADITLFELRYDTAAAPFRDGLRGGIKFMYRLHVSEHNPTVESGVGG